MTARRDTDLKALTEATAEQGCVTTAGGVVVAKAERWFEDGVHVIRSTEFDLIAEDEDAEKVIEVFVDNAVDLAIALNELQADGKITEDESRVLNLLSQRFFEAARASERARHRHRIQIQLRNRGNRSGHWRRQAQRANSTTPSLA
ncbi:MAG TPA: hypothetical protein VG321_10320 [Solirubrobacteraceae bacterium]|jgi:hypothetical protein|nr:hypothetical protein [Solirubrobacteraceae bacterium]